MKKQKLWFCAKSRKTGRYFDTILLQKRKSKVQIIRLSTIFLMEKIVITSFGMEQAKNGKTDWNSQCVCDFNCFHVFDIEKFCRSTQRPHHFPSIVCVVPPLLLRAVRSSPIANWVHIMFAKRKLKWTAVNVGDGIVHFVVGANFYFYESCKRFCKQLWGDSSIGRIVSTWCIASIWLTTDARILFSPLTTFCVCVCRHVEQKAVRLIDLRYSFLAAATLLLFADYWKSFIGALFVFLFFRCVNFWIGERFLWPKCARLRTRGCQVGMEHVWEREPKCKRILRWTTDAKRYKMATTFPHVNQRHDRLAQAEWVCVWCMRL